MYEHTTHSSMGVKILYYSMFTQLQIASNKVHTIDNNLAKWFVEIVIALIALYDNAWC